MVGRPARGAAGRVGGGACVRFVCAGRRPVRRRRHARQERLLSGMQGMIGHALFLRRFVPLWNQFKRYGVFIGRIDSNRVRSTPIHSRRNPS
ncbi:hypothetical protein BCEN4_1360004 [Burkholderia cenocepacia]|nr:hypothetical protein BCEN4_1360004 [Burkholderia cenocepacia]